MTEKEQQPVAGKTLCGCGCDCGCGCTSPAKEGSEAPQSENDKSEA